MRLDQMSKHIEFMIVVPLTMFTLYNRCLNIGWDIRHHGNRDII